MPTPNIVGGKVYPTIMLPCGGDKKLKSFHRLFCLHSNCRETLLLSQGNGALGVSGVIRFARQKGWYADKKGYALCIKHAPGARGPSTLKPAQKRAAFARIRSENMASAMKEKEPRVSAPTTIVTEDLSPMATTAEPPRTATREDKRRIRDFLDSNYDDNLGRYFKDWTDEKAATKLNLPRAWVSDLREDLYGPDICEAGQARTKEMLELIAVASKLKDDALSIATRAEELERACRKAIGK